jgi:hypothetical protein
MAATLVGAPAELLGSTSTQRATPVGAVLAQPVSTAVPRATISMRNFIIFDSPEMRRMPTSWYRPVQRFSARLIHQRPGLHT